jgi:uncharacterized protein
MDIELRPVELLVFQATPFCNLDCQYCYLPNRNDRSKITIETITAACKRIVQHNLVSPRLDVVWHQGEPLVLPTKFYDAALAAIAEELGHQRAQHAIQTNATLIDDGWIDFFKRWNITVSVSVDGPPHFHDRQRRTRSQTQTSGSVLAGVHRLKQAGLELNIICVLTSETIWKARELFYFFESIGTDQIGFNIDEIEGANTRSSHSNGDPLPAFRQFFREYFELVIKNGSRQKVRELDRGIGYVLNQNMDGNLETQPIRSLTITHNGDVGLFSSEMAGFRHPRFGRLVFGNVHDIHTFDKLRKDDRFGEVLKSVQRGIALCAETCGYFTICKGGSPPSKLGEHGTFEVAQTVSCQFRRQAVADATTELLEAHLSFS